MINARDLRNDTGIDWQERAEALEDAITDAGLVLCTAGHDGNPQSSISEALKILGALMNNPFVLKRQGI